jgi:hypothetical protein
MRLTLLESDKSTMSHQQHSSSRSNEYAARKGLSFQSQHAHGQRLASNAGAVIL